MHSLLKPRAKNPDSPRTPEQILEFPNQNQEARTKIPQRLLSKSWFLVLGFKSKIPQIQVNGEPSLANYFRLAKYMLIMLQLTQIDAIMYKIQRWRMKIRERPWRINFFAIFERGADLWYDSAVYSMSVGAGIVKTWLSAPAILLREGQTPRSQEKPWVTRQRPWHPQLQRADQDGLSWTSAILNSHLFFCGGCQI